MMLRAVPFVLLLISCSQSQREKPDYAAPVENEKGEKVVRSFYTGGKTKSEMTLKDGKQTGPARSYDENGALLLELQYVNGKRDGLSKRYFAGGKQVSQTTEYKANKMNGMQVRYRIDGSVMSEARYENDKPCTGLKEYLLDHSLKEKYPTIEVTMSKAIDANGSQTLTVRLSEKVKSVRFYTGQLDKNGCLTDDLYFLRFNDANKTATLPYYLHSAGQSETINLIAVFQTLMGNTAIAQRRFRGGN